MSLEQSHGHQSILMLAPLATVPPGPFPECHQLQRCLILLWPRAGTKRRTLRAGHKVPMGYHAQAPPGKGNKQGLHPKICTGQEGEAASYSLPQAGREEPSRENKKSQLPAPVPKPVPVPKKPPGATGASNNQKQE